jgi:hypothetical protein
VDYEALAAKIGKSSFLPVLFWYISQRAFDMLWYKLRLYQHYERAICSIYEISTKA